MAKRIISRPVRASLVTVDAKLFRTLDIAKIAIEEADSMLAVCAGALWHQDCDVDSAVAMTIDRARFLSSWESRSSRSRKRWTRRGVRHEHQRSRGHHADPTSGDHDQGEGSER